MIVLPVALHSLRCSTIKGFESLLSSISEVQSKISIVARKRDPFELKAFIMEVKVGDHVSVRRIGRLHQVFYPIYL
jgi:hypothetical protein